MTTRLAPGTGRSDTTDRTAPRRSATRITFRLPVPPVSGVVRPRLLAVCLALTAVAFLAFCVETSIGEISLPLGDVVRAVFGTGDPGTELIVHELRLPRALAGLLVGIAFGVSGALLQTVTHNPLASPDLMGVTQGAGTAVVAGIVLGWDAGLSTQGLGLLGALTAGLLVYVLAWKGGTTGYRIVLVGVGVSWICTSATDYLMARGQRFQAQAALGWLVGNLNGRTWDQIGPLALTMAVLVPAALLLGRQLRVLQLGDDVARGLGTRVQFLRVAVLLIAVGLVAFGTATAGPVAFVALAAPQVAQRLSGTAFPPPVAAGLTGAVMVLVSDLVARKIIPDTELPVGVVTGVLGAPVLLWLLVRANRAGSGG
ncbi:putative ferrichrome transport system permease protein FhuG [Streptomyces graminofaciens]|jgi:iron complex transport system permease protein|uniref:Ferrichrome transport system permease protein FhuG n=1 Tax=Streptomyces graminofaciens TaxID=68212 RepID=A0ABN5V8U0_9ACTN|nr:iron chelate uptake ABC transporter family permease subunit [Streptomyces graminofaciens]BBC29298.1 putative ferrichrome transport system permease protein FhuG [Streptomyces graminofaciens]